MNHVLTLSKKTLLTFAFSLLFVLLAGVYCSMHAMGASAAELSVRTELVTDGPHTGEVAATICLTNCTDGIRVGAFTLNLSSTDWVPILNNAGHPVIDGYSGFSVASSYNTVGGNKLITISMAASYEVTEDCDFATAYFEPNGTALNPVSSVVVRNLENDSALPVAYTTSSTVSIYTSVLLGDVNGNGAVNASDAQVILSVLSSHNVTSVSVADASTWFSCYAQIADVDGDGYITRNDANQADDANLILQYYAAVMASCSTDNIGTGEIGTTVSICIGSYQISWS